MHVVVVGAGVVGVTSAYELSALGHRVTVIDRASEAAAQTSHANAGLVCPCLATSWASPSAPISTMKSMLGIDFGPSIRAPFDPGFATWSARFLAQCLPGRYRRNSRAGFLLSRYSQRRLRHIARKTAIDYHARREGLLMIYATTVERDSALRQFQVLTALGQEFEVLDRFGLESLEPCFRYSGREPEAGLFAADNQSGDAQLFTRELAARLDSQGVSFRYNSPVRAILANSDGVSGVSIGEESVEADAVVLAGGVESPALTAPLGFKLPIYPVKGMTATFPIVDEDRCPTRGGVDKSGLMAFCPMGDRFRVSSGAIFDGLRLEVRDSDFELLIDRARSLFPHAADYGRPNYWSCLRPMTPRSIPIIGKSPVKKLYINTGHGSMGWTMAAGSAKLLADIISERPPELPVDDFRV